MRSSLISGGLLRSHIGRFMALWIAFAAAWLLCLVLPLGVLAPSAVGKVTGAFAAGWSKEYVGSLVGCAIAAVASVCCVFEYLFNRQAALFAGSLPVSRNALFATAYVAGLLPLLAIELVVFAIVSGMTLVIPAIGIRYCVTWLGLTVGFTFVYYNVAVICAVFSGTRTMTYYLFLLANAFIIFVELGFKAIAASLMWGVSFSGAPLLIWTSPIFGMGYYCLSSDDGLQAASSGMSWLALALYCLSAVAMLIISVCVNKRRNIEVAGNTIVVRGMASAAKLMGGLALGVIVGIIALILMQFGSENELLGTGQRAVLAAATFIGAYLGVFFAQACIVGGGHSLKHSAKMGVGVGLACVLFIVGCSADILGVKRHVPKADEVASVQLSFEGVDATLESEASIATTNDIHSKVLGMEPYVNDRDFYTYQVRFSYKLRNGDTLQRIYDVVRSPVDEHPSEEVASVARLAEKIFTELENVSDSKEGVMSRSESVLSAKASALNVYVAYGDLDEYDYYSEEVDLRQKDVEDFVQHAFKKDLETTALGKACTSSGKVLGELHIDVELPEGRYDSLEYALTKTNCPAIAKWLKTNYGVDILG